MHKCTKCRRQHALDHLPARRGGICPNGLYTVERGGWKRSAPWFILYWKRQSTYVPCFAPIFDPSRPCSLLSDDRALHTGDSRPPEAGSGNLPPPVVGATGAGHVCIPRGSAFAGFSYLLHRGPSLSPTVHRPALRGASRWFLPRSACPNNSAWARMVTGPTSSASTDVHWG